MQSGNGFDRPTRPARFLTDVENDIDSTVSDTHTHTHIYIYIYIYITSPTRSSDHCLVWLEREKQQSINSNPSIHPSINRHIRQKRVPSLTFVRHLGFSLGSKHGINGFLRRRAGAYPHTHTHTHKYTNKQTNKQTNSTTQTNKPSWDVNTRDNHYHHHYTTGLLPIHVCCHPTNQRSCTRRRRRRRPPPHHHHHHWPRIHNMVVVRCIPTVNTTDTITTTTTTNRYGCNDNKALPHNYEIGNEESSSSSKG